MEITKQGNLEKVLKTKCPFCDCEFKYTPKDIEFDGSSALFVKCPSCELPNSPLPPERPVAVPASPELMNMLMQGKQMGPGGMMI